MKTLKTVALAFALTVTPVMGASLAAPAFAEASANASHSGDFIKKRKKLKGSYEIVEREGARFIVFSDDFRAANGPDLKIFLSPQTVADVTGRTAVNGALNLGELQSTRGVQEYEIPADVDLADYASVLVHCEEFAVLWGGSDL